MLRSFFTLSIFTSVRALTGQSKVVFRDHVAQHPHGNMEHMETIDLYNFLSTLNYIMYVTLKPVCHRVNV